MTMTIMDVDDDSRLRVALAAYAARETRVNEELMRTKHDLN